MFAINRAATTVARRAPRAWAAATPQMRWFADEAEEPVERDQLHYDVVCVGGGPAGLSAAIRIKQLALEREQELSVCVVEKGGELGAHILSGNVFETRGLDELFPDWREMGEEGPPIETEVGAWDGVLVGRATRCAEHAGTAAAAGPALCHPPCWAMGPPVGGARSAVKERHVGVLPTQHDHADPPPRHLSLTTPPPSATPSNLCR